jgi:hypothetical protein
MSLNPRMCECGHTENEHRSNGACMATVRLGSPTATIPPESIICPCNDWRPARSEGEAS